MTRKACFAHCAGSGTGRTCPFEQVTSQTQNPGKHPSGATRRYNHFMQCPKCGSEARDVARFCPRCHATLRFECPSCDHEQRHGGTCEKCGVDFMKYLSAMVAVRKAESDVTHSKVERRSNLIKNLILIPFNMGIPLIRDLLGGSRKSSRY